MIDELYKEGRGYEYFTRMREAEIQNEAYRQSEQEAKEIIADLKQENEKLKETASLYKNLYNHHGEVVEWYSKLRNKATLYRIALEEIREIADKELYLKQNSSLTKIINKINEVIG